MNPTAENLVRAIEQLAAQDQEFLDALVESVCYGALYDAMDMGDFISEEADAMGVAAPDYSWRD